MRMVQGLLRAAGAALALSALSAATGAAAAPQALALVTTEGDVELVCWKGECAVELSSFCLQPERLSPVQGTAYRVVGEPEMTLAGITADGRSEPLDREGLLSIASLRTHLAVRASLPEDRMRERGYSRIVLSIGRGVTLVPEAQAGDSTAHSAQEVELLAGALRQVGDRVVDGDGVRMVAARLTGRMINALSLGGELAGSEGGELWSRAVEGDESAVPAQAREMARGVLELCRFASGYAHTGTLKGCLQAQHDQFLRYLNSEYRKSLDAGS